MNTSELQSPASEALWEPWFAGKTFTTDWTSRAFPTWLRCLSNLKDTPLNILEIGAWEGRATIFFLNYFRNSRITCIDLFLLGNGPLFDSNVMTWHADRVTKIAARSAIALDRFATGNHEPYDLIYIDGSHDRDDVITDSALCWRLLKEGGTLIWDDYGLVQAMPSDFNKHQDPRPAIDAFLDWHRDELQIIDVGYQVIVQKTKPHHPPCLLDPARNHGETATLQSIPGSLNLGEFLPRTNASLLQKDIDRGLRAVERILRSSAEEFASRSFLLSCFADYGIPIMSSDIFAPWLTLMNPSGFGALQLPTEFVDFLRVLARLGITSAAEVGCFRGGSSYFMAAVLQRANAGAELTLIDVSDGLVGFDAFAGILNLKKAIPMSSDDFSGQMFDFVFIDGDHQYKGVTRDFANLGKYARKAVAFHDIHGHEFDSQEGGTVRAWNDVKVQLRETHAIYEFAHSASRALGIGLAVVES